MQLKRSFFGGAAVLGLLALAACGCLLGTETIGSGEAARTWHGGKLTRSYNLDYARVWDAASAAVQERRLFVEDERHDALVGHIKFRRADDITGRVDLENLGAKQTRLSVKVGAIGRDRDKRAATTLMDAIDRKLGK